MAILEIMGNFLTIFGHFNIIVQGYLSNHIFYTVMSLLLFLFVFPWFVFTSMLTYVGHTTRSRWSNLNVTCHSRSHWRGIPCDQIFPVKLGHDLLKMYTNFVFLQKWMTKFWRKFLDFSFYCNFITKLCCTLVHFGPKCVHLVTLRGMCSF